MAWNIPPRDAWAMTHHEWWDCQEFTEKGKGKMSIDDVRAMEKELL
jgi:hypothetical protein